MLYERYLSILVITYVSPATRWQRKSSGLANRTIVVNSSIRDRIEVVHNYARRAPSVVQFEWQICFENKRKRNITDRMVLLLVLIKYRGRRFESCCESFQRLPLQAHLRLFPQYYSLIGSLRIPPCTT